MTSELIPLRHIYDVTVNAHRREMADDVVHEQRTFYTKITRQYMSVVL